MTREIESRLPRLGYQPLCAEERRISSPWFGAHFFGGHKIGAGPLSTTHQQMKVPAYSQVR